jgi:Holliday junction resolvase RusA-like endonuclease
MIHFRVNGIPQTKGSAKAFMRPGMKFPVVTNDNAKCKPWQAGVTQAAAEAMRGEPWRGPVKLTLNFYLPRPKGHFGSGKNADKLKPSAPDFHITKPDADKLVRAVKDGLKGVVYGDDSQVQQFVAAKWYVSPLHPCGVEVEASELSA